MEKEHFLDLARNYTSLTIEDTQAVNELQRSYPYSQVVRCLASRGAHDNKLSNAQSLLAISAVYSTDRAILKEIMTQARSVRKPAPQIIKSAAQKPAETPAESASETAETPIELAVPVSTATELSGDELVNEVLSDLNRLQDLKKMFESSFAEFNKYNSLDSKRATKNVTAERTSPVLKPSEKKPPAATTKSTRTPKPPAIDLVPEPSSESLLNEIETSHKRVFPDSKKQKEQLEIIDKFITRQPSISQGVQPATDSADLAEKSAALTDSMVSETLVEILLRQGKKDKAIEVLRKLIWKFPQKKAIFAAQIEDLRK